MFQELTTNNERKIFTALVIGGVFITAAVIAAQIATILHFGPADMHLCAVVAPIATVFFAIGVVLAADETLIGVFTAAVAGLLGAGFWLAGVGIIA